MNKNFSRAGVFLGVMAICLACAGDIAGEQAARVDREGKDKNSIRLIRNATMIITYAGRTLLTDPMLSAKGLIKSFAGLARNPTVDLPAAIEKILEGIDGVLVTHLHPDHFDKAAFKAIPKDTPLFCQPRDDAAIIKAGFKNVTPIESSFTWEGITITRVNGQHGKGKILELMGTVSGFVLQAPGEPTLYWAGDSIWCDDVSKAIAAYRPDVIITHSGGATIPGYDPIIMNGEDTIATVRASGKAVVVAVHMEALDHCTVSRHALRQMADKERIPASRLRIPADGETIVF